MSRYQHGSFHFSFTGNYQKALEMYKDIHRKFPENVECNSSYFNRTLDQQQMIHYQRAGKIKNKNACCLSRPAFFGEAVHRHGIERSPRIRHQAEEGGEDEGDQRTGLSLQAFFIQINLCFHSCHHLSLSTQEVMSFYICSLFGMSRNI